MMWVWRAREGNHKFSLGEDFFQESAHGKSGPGVSRIDIEWKGLLVKSRFDVVKADESKHAAVIRGHIVEADMVS